MPVLTLSPARHLLCAAALCLAAGLVGASAPTSSPGASPPLSRHDEHVISKAAKLGAEKVYLSQLAATRASRPEVRALARQIVDVGVKASSDLAQLAQSRGLILPEGEKLNLARWAQKKGTDFDRDYLEEMIDGHRDAVELLESSAARTGDPDLAAYARDHLAALQEHLRTAKELHKMID